MNTVADAEEFVALAEVARPHGIGGELRLKIYNVDSDLILRIGQVRLVPVEGPARQVKLSKARQVPGAILVRLEGIRDRDAAESLRGARFEVPRSALDPLDDDEFYVCDLKGCQVLLGGEPWGKVVDIVDYPTCQAMVVQKAAGGQRLEVPLEGTYLGKVHTAEGTVELLTVEGLE